RLPEELAPRLGLLDRHAGERRVRGPVAHLTSRRLSTAWVFTFFRTVPKVPVSQGNPRSGTVTLLPRFSGQPSRQTLRRWPPARRSPGEGPAARATRG